MKNQPGLIAAIDIEQIVLGALLIDKKAFFEVGDMIFPALFTQKAHQTIAKHLLDLNARHTEVDLITLRQSLEATGELSAAGGDVYLVELTRHIASSAHIEHHAFILTQQYVRRELVTFAQQSIREAGDDTADIFDAIGNNYKSLNNLVDIIERRRQITFSEYLDISVNNSLKRAKGKVTGVKTVSNFLNSIGGFANSELTIIAARPSMGKTAFALENAMKNVMNGIPVAFFSLEMSAEQIVNRIICAAAGINSDRYQRGISPEEHEKYCKVEDALKKAPLHINDNPSLNIDLLSVKAKQMQRKYGIEAIYIDYLQLMASNIGKHAHREQQVSEISRGLKILSKDLDIPVIALSQLSRSVESRDGKKPQLSDLRESGAIEQDADKVIFLYRPEYYGIKTLDEDDYGYGVSSENICELLVAKNRNGKIGQAAMHFDRAYGRFLETDLNFNPVRQGNEVGF